MAAENGKQQASQRAWVIDREDYATEEDFRQAVVAELAGLENIGHRMGRAFIVTPLRHRVEGAYGQEWWETRGWLFEERFTPGLQSGQPAAEEPEAAPPAAEPAPAASE